MAKVETKVALDLTVKLWAEVGDKMYDIGEMTFDQVATREEGIAEVVDAIAKAAPFVQPHLRHEATVNFTAAVEP